MSIHDGNLLGVEKLLKFADFFGHLSLVLDQLIVLVRSGVITFDVSVQLLAAVVVLLQLLVLLRHFQQLTSKHGHLLL